MKAVAIKTKDMPERDMRFCWDNQLNSSIIEISCRYHAIDIQIIYMLSNSKNLNLYSFLQLKLSDYTENEIEDGIMKYCLDKLNLKCRTDNVRAGEVEEILAVNNMHTDLESIVEFFEFLVEKDNKDENGVVFTPKYISDYIVSKLFSDIKSFSPDTSIIDPGCGGGIFLVSAAEFLHKNFNIEIDDIINNNLYGIELDNTIARRCRLVLRLLSALHGGDFSNINPQIVCSDSLKQPWNNLFKKIIHFDYVIGNPPYVNPHDLNRDTVNFLKDNFTTTSKGVFNIFYAFIEQSMKYLGEDGKLGFIVPNNFLTIKSALQLRKYIQLNGYLTSVLDFGDNMVFRPVRTYNCILFLNKKTAGKNYSFYVMPGTENIEAHLAEKIPFIEMPKDKLDPNGWKLVDQKTHDNIEKIESQRTPIKTFIRTGIATLRDSVYLVDADEKGFYKIINGVKLYIENDLVKPIYKIPELTLHDNITAAERHIIFPYIKSVNGYVLIGEENFQRKYPMTYKVLKSNKNELDTRDKGKKNPAGWYAYGRTQGLNKYGQKLLFPAFSNHPKFIYLDNEDALFCNGYAIFENDSLGLDILAKILNSYIMDYYVRNTSYPIEGGYYCYQKKYIENFSIPYLTDEDTLFIRSHSGKELDLFLRKLYCIDID